MLYNLHMVNLIVPEKYNNKKLSKFLLDKFPKLSFNEFNKALRKKDIKINNTRVNKDILLTTGDNLCIYIIDSILYSINENLDIVFEDNNILIINKPQGLPVIGEENTIGIMDLVKKHYNNTNICPKPCHRLDTNTSGLLIIAKNDESEKILLQKFKNREIKKFYKATVLGIPKKNEQTLKAYLFKDAKKNRVFISDTKKNGYIEIITKYKLLFENKKNNTSELEVELITRKNTSNSRTFGLHWPSNHRRPENMVIIK